MLAFGLAFCMVPVFDERNERNVRLPMGSEDVARKQLELERREETLGDGTLSANDQHSVTSAFPTHRFVGFDSNTESERLGIARYLIEKMDHFPSFVGRSLNSHMPILDSYLRMLTALKGLDRDVFAAGGLRRES